MATAKPGRLIRMRALKPSELPPHPELAPQQSAGSPSSLADFASEVLAEADAFMTTYLPKEFKIKDKGKKSPPSTATVEVFAREIAAGELPAEARGGDSPEVWFARASVHENAAKDGTASWEEFDGGLRANHSQHEMEYTPDVQEAHTVLDWNTELANSGHKVGTWEDVEMSIVEMKHHIPPPLNDRVFSVLVVTAKHTDDFLVVQIPVDVSGMPGAKYSGNKKVQHGMYCSIERGELLQQKSQVKWQMATASDAKGVLPMAVQKMAVPGAVVKDVGLFISWTAKRRQGKAQG